MQQLRSTLLRSVSLLHCAPLLLLAAPVAAQTEYEVVIEGVVEFNGITTGPLGNLAPGDDGRLSFRVRDDVFVDSASFPTRGYRIAQESWDFAFPGGSVPLQSPYSAPDLLFVIRNNDPGVDGFLVSSVVDFPVGVPLAFPGVFGPFENSFQVTYGPDLLPSLDIADAVGDYDFTGLTVFNWTIDDGPFNPLGLVFESMRIVPVTDATLTFYGCGANPGVSLILSAGGPVPGATLEFGLTNPLGTQAAGSLGLLFLAFEPDPLFPCGTLVPGLGMGGPGAAGELLLSTSGPLLDFAASAPWGGVGTFADVTVPLPDSASVVGLELFAQGALIDPLATFGVTIGLTNGIAIQIGS